MYMNFIPAKCFWTNDCQIVKCIHGNCGKQIAPHHRAMSDRERERVRQGKIPRTRYAKS